MPSGTVSNSKVMSQVGGAARGLLRDVLRAASHATARLVSFPPLRRLLWPSEYLDGPGSLMRVGRFSYFKGPAQVHRYGPADGPITIGNYCSIADDVEFLAGGHHQPAFATTFPFGTNPDEIVSKGPIAIGNDVWIGRGAMILSGVTIGDGAVIGARALVTKDVRPYAIVAGVPAVELRRRFSDIDVERFLRIRWWEWDDAKVRAHAAQLQTRDIETFLRAAEAELPQVARPLAS